MVPCPILVPCHLWPGKPAKQSLHASQAGTASQDTAAAVSRVYLSQQQCMSVCASCKCSLGQCCIIYIWTKVAAVKQASARERPIHQDSDPRCLDAGWLSAVQVKMEGGGRTMHKLLLLLLLLAQHTCQALPINWQKRKDTAAGIEDAQTAAILLID